jgi:CheY-like chemotaxis protein
VIVVSVELPRMSGFWVCSKLKKDERFRDVPLILVSQEATEATFEEHKKLKTRAEAYLHKPFLFDQLRSEIERQLAASQARNQAMAGEPREDAVGNGWIESCARILDRH